MNVPSIFRYPGGKTALVKKFLPCIPENIETYVEPFVGGGSVLLKVAKRYAQNQLYPSRFDLRFLINDSNPDVAAFWSVLVGEEFHELCSRTATISPSVEIFHVIQDAKYRSAIDRAFRCLFVNRTSFSGIMDSGPIGGKGQKDRSLNVRWKPPVLIKEMKAARTLLLGRTTVTCLDFSKVLEGLNKNAFVYLDPPYYEKGGQLYGEYGKWTEDDHARLRSVLGDRSGWLLSYDNNTEVKKLYGGFKMKELQHYRSISSQKTRPRDKSELLIFSKENGRSRAKGAQNRACAKIRAAKNARARQVVGQTSTQQHFWA
jgi:DNA adenine methylase